MDDSALDKLITDIQDFLREADSPAPAKPVRPRDRERESVATATTPASRALTRSARVARLLEVLAFGWLACIATVVGYLMWREPPRDAAGIFQVVVLCTFGVFTTLTLLGGAHRLAALLRIERNAREILRLRRRQNALLSRFVDRR